jgi:radical SAM protein with 4Fe4S-binding SPASM domain
VKSLPLLETARATPLPTYIQLEPVGQCNLRCQMCPIQFRTDGPPHGPPAFMDFDLFTRIIDDLPTLRELHLQGLGEPMMHPRFFDMVRYAVEREVVVSTNTNGTLLNERRAEQCVTSGLETLHLSLDGASAETYERIRERAHFDRVLRNLGHLLRARDGHGSDRPRLRLVMVVMRQNLPELPDLVRLAHANGITTMFVQHLCHDFGESSLPAHYAPMRAFVQAQTLLGEDPARVARYFDEAALVATALGLDLRLPRPEVRAHPPGTPGRERCDWPWHGPYISYQGYSMPCCMIATPDRYNFGSVREQGVVGVWQGAEYEAFRAQLESETPPEICRSCAIYNGTF